MGLTSTRTLTVVSPNVVTYNVLIDGLAKKASSTTQTCKFRDRFPVKAKFHQGRVLVGAEF